MAFKFQINNDLSFKHDDYFLNKAESYRPAMYHQTITAKGLCQLAKDDTKLEGYTCVPTDDQLDAQKMKKDDLVILDFSTHCVGQFFIDIDSVGSPMDAPLYIRLRFAEVPAELAHTSDDYDGWLARGWIQEEFIHLDELPVTLTLPRRYSFRYVEIKVIDTSPKWQAVFSNPQVETVSSANEDTLKTVTVDDPELQAIYNVGLKTLHDCMTDVFEDGPKRDRRLWLGDLRLQALANYATYHNADLVKRCLYLFAGMTTEEGKISANVFVKPRNVPDDTFLFDYSLFFISSLYDYLNAFDEKEVLEDLYPIAKTQMDISLSYVKDGQFLFDDDYPVFVDWSNDFDKQTCGQAIMIYVLKQFIHLGQQMNDDMTYYEEAIKVMTDYAISDLYDTDRHLFKTRHDEYNIASQVWMVLAEVLDAEASKALMQTTINELFPVKNIATPYMYHHITEAMFKVGLKDEAIKMMKDYWGKMIKLGADTYWEAFDPDQPDYSPYGSPIISSYCHAWSCTPVYLISKYL